MLLDDLVERIDPVGAIRDIVAFSFEKLADVVSNRELVIDDEDASPRQGVRTPSGAKVSCGRSRWIDLHLPKHACVTAPVLPAQGRPGLMDSDMPGSERKLGIYTETSSA
jgi:hypothetical protein